MQLSKIHYLLIFLLPLAFAQGQSLLEQKVNLTGEQMSAEAALRQLGEQSGLALSFSPSDLVEIPLRNYSMDGIALGQALTAVLIGTSLDFKISGKRLLIFRSKTRLLSGFVTDAASGEFLVNATVVDAVQNVGVTTNEYGFFSLSVFRDNFSLAASYVGYKTQSLRPENLKPGQEVQFTLEADAFLPEVEIRANAKDLLSRDNYQSVEIQKALVDLSPSLGGAPDFLRAAQLLPGVNGGIDGFGGMQVRGGEAGQNMMLLDGVTVFLPYHLLGAFSIYNPNIVNSAKLVQGSFPARYGGRVSAFFDVRTREGNQYQWQSQVSANLINANVVTEGPIAKGKGAILVSARYSPSGALFNSFFKNTIFQNEAINLSSNFYDLNLKANYQLGANDRIYLSLFHGADGLLNVQTDTLEDALESREVDFNWSNTIGSLRWNHVFNSSLFANTTLTYSNYGFGLGNFELFEPSDPDEPTSFFLYTNAARNNEVGISSDFDYFYSNALSLRFGAGASQSRFNLELSYIDQEDVDPNSLDDINAEALEDLFSPIETTALQAHTYGEALIKLNRRLEANLGLRLSYFNAEDYAYFLPEPRFSLSYRPNKQSHFHLSGTRMVQYIHLVASTALRLPSDLWLPSSENTRPQDAWQGELGYEYRINSRWKFLSTVYYRDIRNVQAYVDSINYLEEIEDDSTRSYLTPGTATSLGWENSLQYTGPKNGLLISYTLARADRQFADHNFGARYPYEFDQRHQWKVFAYQKWGDFDFSINWVYFSPTPRISFIALEGGDISRVELNSPGNKNQLRSEAYHRLDLNIAYHFQFKKTRHSLQVGAYNIYNRENVALYEVDDADGLFQTFPIGSLGFLPSLSYSVKF